MKSRNEKWFALSILLPAIIIVFGVVLIPLIQTFIFTFKDMKLISATYDQFLGLANYIEILSDAEFWSTVGRTGYFTVVSLIVELSLGILIALLINENLKGRAFLRTVIILPWAVPTIVNGALWKWIYHPEYGALNALFSQLGVISEYKSWLGDPWLAMNMIIFADAWKMTPLVVMFMLASMQMVNKSMYEAAVVDGAGPLERFLHLTLPHLKPTILVVLVMRTMEMFKVFDIIYATTRGGPANGTLTLTYDAYLKAFVELDYSKGATISYLIAFFVIILTIIYVRIMKEKGA
ncbi:carbohydrate ABC transporter permease [Bacillus sp. SG-1]|uniref:carbohydrate ABC transporter permease n=1 Tax=Bacillus sp. SG-1 TaxID=161544 RepID=UPI000154379D|nr:sugar ABC transporter permease [Bacillus sp. SG-1]EDL66556.1 putative sugar uptake ABC transporter permease protein [Bacillus sp. SG-1]